jgi:hypothetical protein
MEFVDQHLGTIRILMAIVEMLSLAVIAGATTCVAIILRSNNRKEK